MLECTWNDAEAELALRRMLLKEKKQKGATTNDPKQRMRIEESDLAHPAAINSVTEDVRSPDTL